MKEAKAGKPIETAGSEEGLDFVDLGLYIPGIFIDLKYATSENFMGEIIYDFHKALLRRRTAEKLKHAAAAFSEAGLRLLVWDAFRPQCAQEKLWQVCPDTNYVANPYAEGSNHTRGTAVDVTLADLNGNPVVMPTGFDSFTLLADRDYSDVQDETAKANVLLLESVMKACGFDAYQMEWWHFSDNESAPLYKEKVLPL
jgi:D-alanyl-D-alanine dipeptidase